MAIAALIAVVCAAAVVLINVGSDRDGGADGIVTSAVLARAGAKATPSLKPTDIAAPDTVTVRERSAR